MKGTGGLSGSGKNLISFEGRKPPLTLNVPL
jgi:hypothetical protein